MNLSVMCIYYTLNKKGIPPTFISSSLNFVYLAINQLIDIISSLLFFHLSFSEQGYL
jgi:hypothetical protein